MTRAGVEPAVATLTYGAALFLNGLAPTPCLRVVGPRHVVGAVGVRYRSTALTLLFSRHSWTWRGRQKVSNPRGGI